MPPTVPPNRRTVEAYHGTSVKIGAQIQATGVFQKADYSGSWLGTGIYVWEGDRDRAEQFANDRFGRNYMVFKVTVRLGNCLDLTQRKWVPIVRAAYDDLRDRSLHRGEPMVKNRGRKHYLDCQVINHLCETRGGFDTVRSAFIDGDRIYPRAELFDHGQVMIAVRNPAMILGPPDFVAQGI